MKVFAAILLLAASASARSGPYLPSGWRPEGPAFFLPTEVEKPAPVQESAVAELVKETVVEELMKEIIETVVQESEASGSDFLREYGPPALDLQQSLPDVSTEQTFAVIAARSNDDAHVEAVEEKSAFQEEEETATESQDIELKEEIVEEELKEESDQEEAIPVDTQVVETAEKSSEIIIKQDSTEAVVSEESEVKSVLEEEKLLEESIRAVEENVKTVAEALVTLNNEVNAEQVQTIVQLKTAQESSGSSVPEGFLEYGPPGFREYGPPKDNILAANEEKSTDEAVENNETRRRRFVAAKSRLAKKH